MKQDAVAVIDDQDMEVLPALTSWTPPENPSWDRARKYADRIKKSVEDIVNLGMELQALQNQFFNQGGSGRFGSPQGAANRAKGWQETVREELGISDDTAYRIIERATIIVGIKKLQAGEAVDYVPKGSKETRILNPTPENIEQASAALEQVIAGTVSPPRAWAGLCGEIMRRENQGGSVNRAAVDHAKNLRTALIKLETSLPHWKHLDSHTRLDIEELWKRVCKKIPETWSNEKTR